MSNESTDRVYVVFHGLITLVRRPAGHYTGFFVEMPDHEYLAGSWLNERPIPPTERLALRGVKPGKDAIDGTKNLLVKVLGDLDTTGSSLRQISVPQPKVAHSIFTKSIDDNLRDPKPSCSSAIISAVTIFEYEPDGDIGRVRLARQSTDETVWTATTRLSGLDLRSVAVLHLFSEPRFMPKEQHFTEEFKKTFTLLGHGHIGGIRNTIEIPPEERAKTAIHCPGLKRQELGDLVSRENVVKWVAQQLLDPEASPRALSSGSEPAVCGGGGGCQEC